jgi:hypothetical protein
MVRGGTEGQPSSPRASARSAPRSTGAAPARAHLRGIDVIDGFLTEINVTADRHPGNQNPAPDVPR